jgi:glutaminyl-peptide cyclotransferase
MRRSQRKRARRRRVLSLRAVTVAVAIAAGIAVAAGALIGDGASGLAGSQKASPPPTRDVPAPRDASPPVFDHVVVNVYPHDPQAFTQGLVYRDGFLYESTGLKGQSSLRKVRLETGDVLQRASIDARYFAEGLTDWGSRLVQLTWETNVGFVYDLSSFARQRTFMYPGEGWGLTHDARRLIMSDGTPTLRFIDPDTLQETGRVSVKDGGRAVDDLNELEFVQEEVYANVWLTERIAMIAPATGRVTGWIDLTGLRPPPAVSPDAVANGIAYDAERNRLFVTGKLWPSVFEIVLRPR